jgi:hypothetical protein
VLTGLSFIDSTRGWVVGRNSTILRYDSGAGYTPPRIVPQPVVAELGNYPNPFNPRTKISFKVLESSLLTIRLFNINGEEISRLADHREYFNGSYSVDFDFSNYSTGVYLVQILSERNKYQITRKLLYIK